jgi:hypothetical protein
LATTNVRTSQLRSTLMTKIACAAWFAVLSVSALTAQTNGSWERVYSSLMGQAVANAHGHANVSFFPEIISIRNKPFTATRTYSDQRMENGENVGDPITAKCTIARDDKGRIHYEMAFESVEEGKLVIGGFDVQIYDPVAHTLSRYFAKADHSLPSEPTAEVRKLKLMSEVAKTLPAPAPKDQGEENGGASTALEESNSTRKASDPPPIIFIPTKDNLPVQSVDGIAAVIHRTILKYGEKQQFFQIHEDWLSPVYAMDIRSTTLSETTGNETVETKDIVPGRPDLALFGIPPGYVIELEH